MQTSNRNTKKRLPTALIDREVLNDIIEIAVIEKRSFAAQCELIFQQYSQKYNSFAKKKGVKK